nr:hypothetical protein [Kineosporia sp. NBRC 101677]
MLLRRLLLFVPLVLGVVLFVFVVMRFAPTDPALAAFEGGSATSAQLEAFREANGLNDPCRCDTCGSWPTWPRATLAPR